MPSKPLLLSTDRLLLRLINLSDAAGMQRLAGEREIAATTMIIPHPYEKGMSEEWIVKSLEEYSKGESYTFSITLKSTNELTGCIGISLQAQHDRADLGYWIGKPFWRQGYCTEATQAVVEFAFSELDLNRIQTWHFSQNPASGRVMQKLGMQKEGVLRQHVKKWGKYVDAVHYGILKNEWDDYAKRQIARQ